MIIGESAIVRRWEKTMFLWAIFWKIKFREARLLHGQIPPPDGPNRLLIITVAVRRMVFPLLLYFERAFICQQAHYCSFIRLEMKTISR